MKKSVAIIGEGETEWFYFDSLRIAQRYPFKVAPDFPSHSDISHILNLTKRYLLEQYDYIVCLIDMDRIRQVPKEFAVYMAAKNKKEFSKVMFVETYPCTEFWFLLHFLPKLSTKLYRSCDELLPELRKYMPGYEKTKNYFRKTKLFDYLKANGDLGMAMKNAEKLCQLSHDNLKDQVSYSEICKVIKLLNEIMPMKS